MINEITVLRVGGHEFCDGTTKDLLIKSVTMWEGGLIIDEICVTSFKDDPDVKMDKINRNCLAEMPQQNILLEPLN